MMMLLYRLVSGRITEVFRVMLRLFYRTTAGMRMCPLLIWFGCCRMVVWH